MSKTIKSTKENFNQIYSFYKGYSVPTDNVSIYARIKYDGCSITFYKNYTILFQGLNENKEYNRWVNDLNLDLNIEQVEIEDDSYYFTSAIGSDEVGVGDYFGPIVVCAAYVSKDQIQFLREIGVKDSKLLTDQKIIDIAFKIKDKIKFSAVSLLPEKFNSLSLKNSNLNYIKSALHNKAILSLQNKYPSIEYDHILIDEFTPKANYLKYLENTPQVEKNVTTIVRGESSHLSIAAASILARTIFLKELSKLSTNVKTTLYKGASHSVDMQAVALIKTFGLDILTKVAKVKYKNTDKIMEYLKNNNIRYRQNRDNIDF